MMYGHRARIGYTVAAVTTEVFPIDWYKIVPDGVTLMMITLPLGDRSPDDVKKCFDISIEAAHTFASAGADLVLLGGLPINLSRGLALDDFLKKLEDDIGVRGIEQHKRPAAGLQGARLAQGRHRASVHTGAERAA